MAIKKDVGRASNHISVLYFFSRVSFFVSVCSMILYCCTNSALQIAEQLSVTHFTVGDETVPSRSLKEVQPTTSSLQKKSITKSSNVAVQLSFNQSMMDDMQARNTTGVSSSLLPMTSTSPFSKEGQENQTVKVLLYLTTHFSQTHVIFLRYCWPQVLKRSKLLRRAHVVYASPSSSPSSSSQEGTVSLQDGLNLTRHIFSQNPSLQFQINNATSNRSHGAIQAMSDAFEFDWLNGYDWVIRLNPNVMVRDDSYLSQQVMANTTTTTMVDNSTTVQGVFADCYDRPCPRSQRCTERYIHTDFIMFRPDAVPRNAFVLNKRQRRRIQELSAERLATKGFRSLVRRGADRWIPGVGPHGRTCRIGHIYQKKRVPPIIHTHSIAHAVHGGGTCPLVSNA